MQITSQTIFEGLKKIVHSDSVFKDNTTRELFRDICANKPLEELYHYSLDELLTMHQMMVDCLKDELNCTLDRENFTAFYNAFIETPSSAPKHSKLLLTIL
jgi:folate-dependent tRNA-U54 methylase TrmFO/GidA